MRVKYIQNCLRRKVFGEFMVDFMYEFRLVYMENCKICKLKWKFSHWLHLLRWFLFSFIYFFFTSLLWCEGIRKLIFLHISVSRRFFSLSDGGSGFIYICILKCILFKYIFRKFTLLLKLHNLNVNHNLISKCVNKV